MRENRRYGSEGGSPVMDRSPTPISTLLNYVKTQKPKNAKTLKL